MKFNEVYNTVFRIADNEHKKYMLKNIDVYLVTGVVVISGYGTNLERTSVTRAFIKDNDDGSYEMREFDYTYNYVRSKIWHEGGFEYLQGFEFWYNGKCLDKVKTEDFVRDVKDPFEQDIFPVYNIEYIL